MDTKCKLIQLTLLTAIICLAINFSTEAQSNTTNTTVEEQSTYSTDEPSNSSDVESTYSTRVETTYSTEARPRARGGIKGGLNISNLFIDEVHDENARIGMHVGIYGQIFSTEAFAIQPELLFTTKGSDNQYEGAFNQDVKYNLNYIELPLLAVFKIGTQVEIHLGGYGSYLVGANISYDGGVANGVDEIDRDHLRSTDFGLVAGIGFNFGEAVQLGTRYNYGLTEIADSDGSRALIGDAKNSCAQIFIAFNFTQ